MDTPLDTPSPSTSRCRGSPPCPRPEGRIRIHLPPGTGLRAREGDIPDTRLRGEGGGNARHLFPCIPPRPPPYGSGHPSLSWACRPHPVLGYPGGAAWGRQEGYRGAPGRGRGRGIQPYNHLRIQPGNTPPGPRSYTVPPAPPPLPVPGSGYPLGYSVPEPGGGTGP